MDHEPQQPVYNVAWALRVGKRVFIKELKGKWTHLNMSSEYDRIVQEQKLKEAGK